MRPHSVLLPAAVVSMLALLPGEARAVPVNVEFHGGIFGLELLEPDAPLGPNQYLVQYTADLTSFDPYIGNEGNWDLFINAIAFKVGVDVIAAQVWSTNFGTPADWNPVILSGWMSGSGAGCTSGSADAICADVAPALAPSTTSFYSWNFLLTTAGGVPTVYGQPIRAEFLNGDLEHSGLLSETTPWEQVPEPASVALFGLGLLGAAFVGRRRH